MAAAAATAPKRTPRRLRDGAARQGSGGAVEVGVSELQS